jgi:RNA polymerase sigma factor (sigma-70 family)
MNKQLNFTAGNEKTSLCQALEQAYYSKEEGVKNLFLEILANDYFEFLYLICLSYLKDDRTMDAVQETFIKVYEKIGVIYLAAAEKKDELNAEELDAYIREYIGRLARNFIIDHYFRRKRNVEELNESLYNSASEKPKSNLWEVVNSLNNVYCQALVYKFKNGWSRARIAEEMQIPQKRVDRYVGQGLSLLKQKLAS